MHPHNCCPSSAPVPGSALSRTCCRKVFNNRWRCEVEVVSEDEDTSIDVGEEVEEGADADVYGIPINSSTVIASFTHCTRRGVKPRVNGGERIRPLQ